MKERIILLLVAGGIFAAVAMSKAAAFSLQDAIMGSVLAAVSVIFYRVLVLKHTDHASRINLEDLLVDPATNKMSKAAAVMFVALAVSSWVIFYQSFKGALTDMNFAAYLTAWVAPTVTKIIKGEPEDPKPVAGPTTTVSANKVEIKQ